VSRQSVYEKQLIDAHLLTKDIELERISPTVQISPTGAPCDFLGCSVLIIVSLIEQLLE
jgi:hypothetical protein